MREAKIIVVTVIAVLAAVILILNRGPVTLQLVFTTTRVSLAALLLLAILAGVVIGAVGITLFRRRKPKTKPNP